MFKDLTHYKPNLEKTLMQMNRTYVDALEKKGGNVTLRTLPPEDIKVFEDFDLTKYNFIDDIEVYADDLCRLLESSFEARKDVDDNMIPAVTPVLGIGDFSAFVAGDIHFRKHTSWSVPVLKRLDDWKALPPLGQSPWYPRLMAIHEALIKRARSGGIPFTRGYFSPLDLAAALRGDAIYTDFFDDPEGVRDLLDYCAKATIHFADDVYRLAKKYLGDTAHGMWYLEGCINMGEDIACNISKDLYDAFCRPYTEKIVEHFGRGHMHTHSSGMQLLHSICTIPGVVSLWLPTDPNTARPIDDIPGLIKDVGAVNQAIDCDRFEDVVKAFDAMKRGNFSVTVPVKSIGEAKQLVDRFNRLMTP